MSVPDQKRGARRFFDALGTVVLRALPFLIALVAYKLAGSAKADLASLRTLMQLALGLVAGVASYTIIAEVTLSRLPRRLSRELDVLTEELTPLNNTVAGLSTAVGELSTAVNQQLRTLIDLHGMEILYEKRDALVRARVLQDDASQSIHAMWTNLTYDEALQQYFAETLADDRPFSCRIIAARTVPRDDLMNHIEKTWDRLVAGTYEIFLVHDCNFEALVVDRSTAALFIYSDRGYGSCFLSSPSKEFVNAVEGLFESLKKPHWRIPAELGATDLAAVSAWVDDYYQGLP